jgi:magnesium-protoporphyrin IX monomethyl ester (oxidative) cyclase
LERLRRIADASAAASARGGIVGRARKLALGAAAAATFVRLYLLPTRPNELPQDVRIAPAW